MAILFLFPLFLLFDVPNSHAYDYFTFAQQWPQSFCEFQTQNATKPQCSHPIPGKGQFTIHGLWPSNNSQPQPLYCVSNNTNVDPKIIQNLGLKLNSEWPDLLSPINGSTFWNFEWKKHGTCSEKMFNQLDYFKLALKLKTQNNLVTILAGKQIFPHQNSSYNITSVVDAIAKATNHAPQLNCYKDSQKVTKLKEIRLCLEANGTSYKNCTNSFGNCNANVINWPA